MELHFNLKKREHGEYKRVRALLDLAKEYNIKIPDLFGAVDLDEVKKLTQGVKFSYKGRGGYSKPRLVVERDLINDLFAYYNEGKLRKEELIELVGMVDELFFIGEGLEECEKMIKEKIKEFLENNEGRERMLWEQLICADCNELDDLCEGCKKEE